MNVAAVLPSSAGGVDVAAAEGAERRRVARELHDNVGQLLIAAQFRIREAQRLARRDGNPALQENIDRAEAILTSALQEVRRISHDLRPPASGALALVAALSSLLAEFAVRTGIRTELRRPKVLRDMPSLAAEMLYRIAQEALTNIERHAGAKRVRLRLGRTAISVTLAIADDGRGVGSSPRGRHGLGLLHMSERAEMAGGALTISRWNGKGTELKVTLPLENRSRTPPRRP